MPAVLVTESFLTLSYRMYTTQNLFCVQGEALTIHGTFDVAPVDGIGTWTIAFYLKKQYGDATALVTKTTVSEITVVDPVAGVVSIPLTHADTLRTPGGFVYDVWRIDAGQETVLARGHFTIGAAVRP